MSNSLIAEKIRTLMADRNVDIDDLAQRSGLKKEAIETILNDNKIPSLAPIIKIARALGVRPGTFLDDSEHLGPVVNRKSASVEPVAFSSQFSTANQHLSFQTLAGNKSGRHMEPFIITVSAANGDSKPSSHEGEEFIYVLSGKVKIDYGVHSYVLEAGDSIYYDSIVEHLVSGVNNEPAVILAVVYAPY